jgi:hypothetical protein
MKRTTGYLGVAMAAAFALVATPALAQTGDQPQAPPGGATGPAPQPTAGPSLTVNSAGNVQQAPAAAPAADEGPSPQRLSIPSEGGGRKPLIWRGTSFMFQQAVSSETIGIGKDYQSRNPAYELWFSLRPRLYLYTDAKQSVNINARSDLYKSITNDDDTTQYRQDVFGDIWLNASYGRKLVSKNGNTTSVSIGPRVLLPTSIRSRAAGVILTAGGGGGVSQGLMLNRDGDWFKSARLSASAFYTHAFAQSTTAASDVIDRPRTNINGITGQSNQLSGGFLAEHQVLSVFDSGIQITPKLGLTADLVFVHQWVYTPSNKFATDACDGITVRVMTGDGCATSSGVDPQRYRISPYLLASMDYQVSDELNLEFGYYNFANQLGPDGKRRSPIYSPESTRFYVTATLSLDAFYERFRGDDDSSGQRTRGNLFSKNKTPPSFVGQF